MPGNLLQIDSSLAKLGNEKNFKKHFLPTIRLTDQLNRILLELNLQLEELRDEDSEEPKNNVPSTPTISSPSTPHQSPRREREVSQSPRRDLSKLHTNKDRELCKSSGRDISNNHSITERKVSKSPARDISNHQASTGREVSKSPKRDIFNHHTITEREVSKPPRKVVSKDHSNRERELSQQQRLDSTYKAKEVSQHSRVDSTYQSRHTPGEVSHSPRTELATYHNLKSSEVDNTEMGHRKVMEWNLNYKEEPIRKVSNQKIALRMGSPEFTPSKFELEYKSNKDKSSDTDCENQQPRLAMLYL